MNSAPPPRINPNLVPRSREDAKCALATCPLMKTKVQLLPLRYGRVERLDPSAELAMPYSLDSRPLGVRLLRDGWLYIIVDGQPQALMHEYRVQDGVVSQRLWDQGEITADTRDTEVGEALLLFPRQSTLHVSYSEVQWTAAKCAQVLKHPSERAYFMQAVNLAQVDPLRGARHLLNPHQAEQWLAEVAEQPNSAPPISDARLEESQDYLWEQVPQFQSTQLGLLKRQVKGEYEHDHLYLLIQDDLGVLRDLAEHQDLVSGWISDWSADDTQQKQYVMGSYIETLYTVSDDILLASAQADPRFAPLNEDTSREQRQSILEYLNTKQQLEWYQWSGGDTDRAALALLKTRMVEQLGELYPRYKDLIAALDDNANDALKGARFGQEGINDLIDRPAMEAFLKQQRAQLSRWNNLLDRITDDRIKLVSQEAFHRAAWYFDPKFGEQMDTALATEYACLKDICRTDLATEQLAELLDKQPGFSVPGFFTLSQAEQANLNAKMSLTIKATFETLTQFSQQPENSQTFNGRLNHLLEQQLPHAIHLSENGITFNQLRNSAYEPAKQLAMARALDDSMSALRSGQPLDPSRLLRAIPGAAWLDLLRTFGQSGMTLEFASARQIEIFNADVEKLRLLRRELTRTGHHIRQTLALERKGRAVKGDHKRLVTYRKNVQASIADVETRVAHAMSPVGEGPGKVAFKIKGLSYEQELEFHRMANDARVKLTIRPIIVSKDLFAGAGDVFATAVFVMQAFNFYQVFKETYLKGKLEGAERTAFFNALFSMAGSGFAAAQGIAITTLSIAIRRYASAAGQLKIAARLGKFSGVLGPATYSLGFFAAATGLYGEQGTTAKWMEAMRSGDGAALAGASMALVGDSGQLAVNGWAAARSVQYTLEALTSPQQARALAWATAGGKLLSVFARANLIGLAFTALQLGGEWLYNRQTKSALDQWLQQGPWGKQNAHRSLAEDRLLLAEITTPPRVVRQQVGKRSMVVLHLPGLSVRELDYVGFGLSAYWLTDRRSNDWEAWSEPLLQQLHLLSAPDAPLKLGLEILPGEGNAEHGLGIALRYHPVAGDDNYREKQFETITLSMQDGEPLSAVTVLRARTLDAPWLLVTTAVLNRTDLFTLDG